jgi:hypothetical protein
MSGWTAVQFNGESTMTTKATRRKPAVTTTIQHYILECVRCKRRAPDTDEQTHDFCTCGWTDLEKRRHLYFNSLQFKFDDEIRAINKANMLAEIRFEHDGKVPFTEEEIAENLEKRLAWYGKEHKYAGEHKETTRPYQGLYRNLRANGRKALIQQSDKYTRIAIADGYLKQPETPPMMSFREYVREFVGKPCAYCNADMTWKEYGSGAVNVIRIDRSEKFTKANCVPCCPMCSRSRSHRFTHEQMLEKTRPPREGLQPK